MIHSEDRKARERAVRDLDTTFLVEAGAGTGKTTLLIDRILSILREGRATVQEIVAITFTEKAAAELLAKLRTKLEEERGKGDFAEEALSELDRARVSTIHSFAGSLLKERPVEAGIDPWFEIADEIDSNLLLEEAWELWFGGKGKEGSEPLSRAIRLGIDYERMKEISLALHTWRDLLFEVQYSTVPFSFEEEIRRSRGALEAAMKAAEPGVRSPDEAFAATGKLLDELLTLDLSEPGSAVKRFLPLKIGLKMGKKGNQRNYMDPRFLKDLRAATESVSEDLVRLKERTCCRVLLDLFPEFKDFFRLVTRRKEEKERLDFQDLLLGARNLLKEDTKVRAYFQDQFKYVLVDEFQDTDPLQVELVFFLAEKGQRARDWRQVNLVPGKLFIVGDPKQSIYRFRRADIEMYEEAKKILAERGEVLAITKNFRTVPQLIEIVNEVFENIIVESTEGSYQPDYIPILPGRSVPSHGDPALLLLPPVNAIPEKAGKSALRAEEARHIAAFIKKAAHGGYEVYDKGQGGTRGLAFHDIAVLFPTFTGIDLYEDAFREHEIPYQLEGRGVFYQTEEVRSLVNCLEAIENPLNELSVAAALRSDYFGVSDEELLEWKASGRSFSCIEARRDDIPVPESLRDVHAALAALAEFHELRNRTPVGALIQGLLDRTKTLEAFLLRREGERSAANIIKLVHMARDFELRGQPFGRIVGMLGDLSKMGIEEMESSLSEPGEKRVSLLSIHKSKGLEFPMVILANLAKEGGREGRVQILPRRVGERPMLEVRVSTETGPTFTTQDFEREKEREKEMKAAEEKRLLYVAWTRARDYLVLPTFFRNSPRKCMFDFLAPSLETIDREAAVGKNARCVTREELTFAEAEPPPFLVPDILRSDEKAPTAAQLEERERWREERRALIENAERGIDIVTPSRLPDALEEQDFLPEKIFGDYFPTLKAPGKVPFEERRRIAMGFGNAVHTVLEYMDLDDPGGIGPLSRWAACAFDVGGLEGRVAELVKGALSTEIFARARRGRFYREYPLSAWDGEKLIEGAVDLLIVENDGLTVIDYKTDLVEGERVRERAEHYRPQIEAYVRALEAATGKKVKEASLLFLIPRELVRILP
jgi:ATP-dependent exoDNAse (exonuclease V) beta subunit